MDEQLYHRFFEIEKRHWWFVARQAIVEYLVAHRCHLFPGAKVLDVGCGTGSVLAGLSKQFEAYGTDTSPSAIEYCRKRGLKNAYVCTLQDFPHTELRLDLITMLDVIEHIDDDVQILHQAWNRLAPNGRILLTVPAYQFLWGPHDVANHHKRRYTRSLLKKVMDQSGFIVETVSYFNSILFPLALIRRGIGLLIAERQDEFMAIPPRPVNALLKSVFMMEKYVVRRASFPFGLSVLGIGRKG